MLFLLTFTFISCDKENEEGRKITDYKEYVLTVASEMKPGVMWSDGYNYLKEVYPVKKKIPKSGKPWDILMDLNLKRDMSIKSELVRQVIWITAWGNLHGRNMICLKFCQKKKRF